MSVSPPIGWPVNFIGGADPRSRPEPARVTRAFPDGQVKLAILPVNGGTVIATRTIRHVSDPWLQQHPDKAQKHGSWDYVPGLEPPGVFQRQPGDGSN